MVRFRQLFEIRLLHILIHYYFYVKSFIYIIGDKMIWIKNQEKIRKISTTLWSVSLTVLLIFCAIKYSSQCSQGILNGISFCVTVLIPSLFIFMVIAQYVAQSRLSSVLCRLLKPVVTKLFRLPQEGSIVLFMSALGGYPVGARCISSLYESGGINEEQAKKLSLIAVNSGPGFVLNFVGSALLNNKKAGVILLVSQLLSFFIIALIVGRTYKTKYDSTTVRKVNKNANFVEAVQGGCKATINMCAMVIAFCAVISVCDYVLSDYPVLCDALACVLEVTTACNRMCTKYPMYLVSFAIGFSGICVHFQIYSALKDIKINKLLFFFIRTMQGITSALITYILLILFPLTSEVFSTVETAQAESYTTLWGCCALILTAVCFLNSLSKTKFIRR